MSFSDYLLSTLRIEAVALRGGIYLYTQDGKLSEVFEATEDLDIGRQFKSEKEWYFKWSFPIVRGSELFAVGERNFVGGLKGVAFNGSNWDFLF